MNYGVVTRVLGNLLVLEALLMVPSLVVCLVYGQNDLFAFLISMAIMIVLGLIMGRFGGTNKIIKAREGLTIVTLGWILASFFGCLPFVISGSIPSLVDAFLKPYPDLPPPALPWWRILKYCPEVFCFGAPLHTGLAAWVYWYLRWLSYQPWV